MLDIVLTMLYYRLMNNKQPHNRKEKKIMKNILYVRTSRSGNGAHYGNRHATKEEAEKFIKGFWNLKGMHVTITYYFDDNTAATYDNKTEKNLF